VTFAPASPGGWGPNAIKQAGCRTAARRSTVRLSGSGIRRFLAASSRWVREKRSGHACRVLWGRTFGRGFDSRRLHHSTHLSARLRRTERFAHGEPLARENALSERSESKGNSSDNSVWI